MICLVTQMRIFNIYLNQIYQDYYQLKMHNYQFKTKQFIVYLEVIWVGAHLNVLLCIGKLKVKVQDYYPFC